MSSRKSRSSQPDANGAITGKMTAPPSDGPTHVIASPLMPDPPAAAAEPERVVHRRLRLTVKLDGKDSESHVIDDRSSPLIVGRREESSIFIADSTVSKVHAMLRFDAGTGWQYWDLNSTNGTSVVLPDPITNQPRMIAVNGQLIPVGPGTTLKIGGHLELGFRAEPPPLPRPLRSTEASAAAKQLREEVARVAPHRDLVLLYGESGTGKTHTARILHENSGRRGKFVAVNCASLPQDRVQLEARFHGAAMGAYTGQVHAQQGLFAEAHGGTLFLDEIESMPEEAQGFLLDALDGARQFRPLGADKQTAVLDFRVVAATKLKIADTPLRKDLVNRLLNGVTIQIPNLAERKEDLPGLMDAFALRFAQERDASVRVGFDESAHAWAMMQDWRPGQFRKLEAVLRNAVRASDRGGSGPLVIQRSTLEAAAARYDAQASPDTAVHDTEEMPVEAIREEIRRREFKPTTRLDKEDIEAALKETGMKLGPAAKRLGIALNTLKKKMRELGMRR
jgi:DNA-binding NtrC family response regulator